MRLICSFDCLHYNSAFLSWLQNLKQEKMCRKGKLIQSGDGWGEMMCARCGGMTKGKQLIFHKKKVLQGWKAGWSSLETAERVCCLLKGAWTWMSGHVHERDRDNPQLWKWPCCPWHHSVSSASGSQQGLDAGVLNFKQSQLGVICPILR